MKKILSLLGTITLIGTSTTSLVACNIPQKYTPEELAKLKSENKINTTNQEIKDNLEWIAPQEQSFNEVDNKYYFVVWHGDKENDWNIIKFKNNTYLSDNQSKNINLKNNYQLYLYKAPYFSLDLVINKSNKPVAIAQWRTDKNNIYFKAVYSWNLDTLELNLMVDKNGNVKVNE